MRTARFTVKSVRRRHIPLLPRTAATEIVEVYDAGAAKNQLGHTSNTVAQRHYINRGHVVPDYRAATAT